MMPDAEEALRLAREWRSQAGSGGPGLPRQGAPVARGVRPQPRVSPGGGGTRPAHACRIPVRRGGLLHRQRLHARGAYEDALQWYQQLSDYASTAGDKLLLARVPNVIGGVHLELFDLDEALRLNLEGAEVAQQAFPGQSRAPTPW